MVFIGLIWCPNGSLLTLHAKGSRTSMSGLLGDNNGPLAVALVQISAEVDGSQLVRRPRQT